MELPGYSEAESLVRFESSRYAMLKGFRIAGDTNTFILVEGRGSHDIKFKNNRLAGVKRTIEFRNGAVATNVAR